MDNNPLGYLERDKLGVLEQKWAAHLAHFNYKKHYKPGKFNRHADAFSCYLVESPSDDVDSRGSRDGTGVACGCLCSLPLGKTPRQRPLRSTHLKSGL